MGFAFGSVFAKLFDVCPFVESLVVEQRHKDLLPEQLVIQIFKRRTVDLNARLLYLQEIIF